MEDDLLTWLLLDPEDEEKFLPPVYPILLLDLDLSSAVVVMVVKVLEAEVLGLVPVTVGPCGLVDLTVCGPLGRSSLALVALSGTTAAVFTPRECEFLSCSISCLLFCLTNTTTSFPSSWTQRSQFLTFWSKIDTWSRRILRCALNDMRNLLSATSCTRAPLI